MPNMNLKKLWRRKSVSITEYDPNYKVIYLGNVLTGWAKGDGCVEKPLATLWRNYCQSSRPDISMKVTICGAGLRAVTREHGLTEYWAHRVTHCTAHPAYPRVFCWVYRHEGRRLKQELRCHAVLCPKQGKAEVMSSQLKARLAAALHEFRREKTIRQNARLSIVNALYDSAVLPMRKLYLITGSANYRPPLERSKSAPKLGAIEEILEEEEEYEEERKRSKERENESNDVAAFLRLHPQPSGNSETTSDIVTNYDSSSDCASLGRTCFFEDEEDEEEEEELESRVDICEVDEERLRARRLVGVHFSSPNLLFYPPHTPPDTGTPPAGILKHENRSDLALLESFKDKLGLSSNGEESLTSDQPESIGSHSCSSSCDGGTEEEIMLIVATGEEITKERMRREGSSNGLIKGGDEEEDNISEESGYSEDKECLPLAEPTKVKTLLKNKICLDDICLDDCSLILK